MSSPTGKLAKFLRRPWRDKLLFLEAWWDLGLARFSVLTLPFPRLAAGWGAPMFETPREPPREARFVEGVRWAIQTASRYTPWKSHCLTQAIAGKRMLQKRGLRSTLYLGLARDPAGKAAAHAWLRCGDVYVTGAGGLHFTVVGAFAEADSAAGAATSLPQVHDAFAWLKNE